MKKLIITLSLFLAFNFAEAQYANLGKGWRFKSTKQFDHTKGEDGYGTNYLYWNVAGDGLFEIYFADGSVSRYKTDGRLNGPKKGYTGDGERYTKVNLSNIEGTGYIGVQMVTSDPPYIRLHYGNVIVDFYQ